MRLTAALLLVFLVGCASVPLRDDTIADEAADIEVIEALPAMQRDMERMREALEQMNDTMQAIKELMIVGQERDAKYHHNHMERLKRP